MNKRIQAVEAKRAAASAERYHRLQSLQAHVDGLFYVEVDKEESMKMDRWNASRQASEWIAAVRNQMGIPFAEPIPMEKLCAEIRTARNITLNIGDIDHATRLRLFAAIATVLTPPPR
jgi:hypothetical protein